MKALGVTDLRRFDWLDAPPPATVLRALETLYALGAVDEAGGLTPFGEKVSFFPLDPEMATVLLRSAAHGCAREVVALAAMVSADAMQHRCGKCLWHPLGDHLTLLRLFFSSVNCTEEELWGFCSANRLGYSAMSHARQVRYRCFAPCLRRAVHPHPVVLRTSLLPPPPPAPTLPHPMDRVKR